MATPCVIVNSQRYKDKVTIVTGGVRGIGEGIARVFAKNGSMVVIADIKGRPDWIDEINISGAGEIHHILCDLTKEDDVKSLVTRTVEMFGRLDCLVNNAGWHPDHVPIDDFTADDLRKLMDINLVSQFLTSKYSLPHLRVTQGNIINISSMVNKLGQLYAVTYAATKGAVSAFTRALAIDEAKYHVRVNAISPGNIWTPLWLESRPSGSQEEIQQLKDVASEMQLLGHYGTPEDVGLACLYLAADGTFVTGVDLNLSGGCELDYGYKTRVESDEICRWTSLKAKK